MFWLAGLLVIGCLSFSTARQPIDQRVVGKWESNPRNHRLDWIDLQADGTFRCWNTEQPFSPWQGTICSSTWSLRDHELTLTQQGSPLPQWRHNLKNTLYWFWRNFYESQQPAGRKYFQRVIPRYRVLSVTETELRLLELGDNGTGETDSTEEITFTRTR